MAGVAFWRRSEREGHRPFHHDLSVHAADALEPTHTASQAQHRGFDFHDVAGADRMTVTDPFDAGETDSTAFIERADAALYRAKDEGRNCVCLSSQPAVA